MNDDDDDLGENDSEEALAWPPPERKVVTQSYDLSINTLLEQWDDETLVIPEFQREYVWDDRRASRLIESLLLNIPIPVLYFAETEDARYEVVDGHQRVRSVIRFLKNEVPTAWPAYSGRVQGPEVPPTPSAGATFPQVKNDARRYNRFRVPC